MLLFLFLIKLNYNRMHSCGVASMETEDFDESILRRSRIGNNSGYLDQEYELSRQFPTIGEHHFRIEDDCQILNLEKLRRESQPIEMQSTFNASSQEFKQKLNKLLQGLDSRQVQFSNEMQQQKHGFYTLADSYEDQTFIAAMLQKARIQQVRLKLQEVSIKELKPTFIKKSKKSEKPMSQQSQVQKITKRFNRITISEQHL